MDQEILSGPERRRRWTDEQKLSILREAGQGEELELQRAGLVS